jgi:hypothetical protein
MLLWQALYNFKADYGYWTKSQTNLGPEFYRLDDQQVMISTLTSFIQLTYLCPVMMQVPQLPPAQLYSISELV